MKNLIFLLIGFICFAKAQTADSVNLVKLAEELDAKNKKIEVLIEKADKVEKRHETMFYRLKVYISKLINSQAKESSSEVYRNNREGIKVENPTDPVTEVDIPAGVDTIRGGWLKKYILISISLMLFSCGSRNSTKEKSVEKISESLKQTETVQKSNEVNSSEQSQGKEEKKEISKEKQSNNESLNQNTESNSIKTNSENNSKTTKKTTYFPNGQKKSETETNENYSKLSDEKDYYKATSESLKEENKTLTSEKNELNSEVKNLKFWNKNLLDTTNEISKMYDSQKMELKKATERKSYPFWLWIAVGFFLKILVGSFWKWFKTTSLFAKLPIIKFNNK